jgi:hypothetical protein
MEVDVVWDASVRIPPPTNGNDDGRMTARVGTFDNSSSTNVSHTYCKPSPIRTFTVSNQFENHGLPSPHLVLASPTAPFPLNEFGVGCCQTGPVPTA